MQAGDRCYFTADPTRQLLTIKTVSPFVDMVELEEFPGGWGWAYSIVVVENPEEFIPGAEEPAEQLRMHDALDDFLDSLPS